MTLPSGTKLGRYEIRSQIGEGGMGEVYLAQDTQLGRQVAVKFLPAELTGDEEANKRLIQEARAGATIDHPNICAVYEVSEAGGRSFIVMQYLEGKTLDARIQSKPLALKDSIAIAVEIADALAEAHSRGIIHRDIKPANIMITSRGQAKVMDFGLARLVSRAAESEARTQRLLTTPGTILGTVPYMSPEQVKGEKVDVRTDIFSFGVVLYEMLSGHQPFTNRSAAETISAILNEEPPTLSRYAPDLPEELQRIARKCLEKDRNLRYQNASDVRVDLQRLQRDTESVPVTISKPETSTEAEAPPTGNKAVYAFLELFALAFTFEGAGAMLRGESWWRVAGAWLVAVIFFVAGIQWPRIRVWLAERFGSRKARAAPTQVATVKIANLPGGRKGVRFRARHLIVPAVTVVLAFLAAAYFYFPRAALRPSEIKSLAVLPLKSLDAGENYLGLGIADAVIGRINQTEQLVVRPTSAVRRYLTEDTDALTAARQLHADAVLEGSVQHAGDILRVSVNLLRTSDGVSLWSDHFDMRMTDIFTIQDTVAQKVASRLQLQLDSSQQARLTKRYTSNPTAYDFYLKGIFSFDQRVTLAKPQWEGTIELFKKAIEADPNFALAHAQLAYVYATWAVFYEPTVPLWAERAKEEINQAQALDPQLAETHLARFQLLFSSHQGYQGDAAVREVLLAQQLNPNVGHGELAYLFLHLGLEDLGLRELKRGAEIDPTSEFVKQMSLLSYQAGSKYDEWFAASQKLAPDNYMKAWYFIGKGDLVEAQTAIDAWAAKSPEDTQLPDKRALLLALKGDFRAAEGEIPIILSKHPAKDPRYHHAAYDIACVYALEGKSEEALKWLRDAAVNGFPCYPLFERDRYLNRIRQAPEFVHFMAEMKTQNESYQREFGESASR
jgi:TolB-like protein/predicted Ser/Thr protein kinase